MAPSNSRWTRSRAGRRRSTTKSWPGSERTCAAPQLDQGSMMPGTTITLDPFGTAPAGNGYASIPDRPRRGMVVIHEAFGPQPEIDRVVDRFAAAGYAAMAPVLFKSFLNPQCVRAATMAMQQARGPFVDRIRG